MLKQLHSEAKYVLAFFILAFAMQIISFETMLHCFFNLKNQSPKGIMRSAVPLPCFFDVVKSHRIAGVKVL